MALLVCLLIVFHCGTAKSGFIDKRNIIAGNEIDCLNDKVCRINPHIDERLCNLRQICNHAAERIKDPDGNGSHSQINLFSCRQGHVFEHQPRNLQTAHRLHPFCNQVYNRSNRNGQRQNHGICRNHCKHSCQRSICNGRCHRKGKDARSQSSKSRGQGVNIVGCHTDKV